MFDEQMIERFWLKVDRSGGPDACWLWLAARKKAGYGNFFVKRTPPGRYGHIHYIGAHRFAYIITKGPIADDHVVRHMCDNPPCCNPSHLVPGTVSDNTRDAIERGLWNPRLNGKKAWPKIRAAQLQSRTLSIQDIAHIISLRAEGLSVKSIANTLNISEAIVHHLMRGDIYADVPFVARLGQLHDEHIRFPYPQKEGRRSWGVIHPELQLVIDEARQLVARQD